MPSPTRRLEVSAAAARRLLPVLLAAGTLMSCAAAAPTDPRTPSELAAPPLEDWRAAAHGLADDIAPDVAARSILGPASLAPIEGSAPSFFHDLLLADLVENGVPIVEADGAAALRIACRATPLDVIPTPRGQMRTHPLPSAEIFVLCLIAHNGAYLAMEERSLSLPPRSETPAKAIVIEVSG
ncbi:MAG: hypothetical protein JO255_01530 [Alphaproteobacteria bacterium]|nr:hypothetical protein [Alphaproteobacteria bacterium]